ncbi:MAG: 2-dehydro-3-deoxygalactonokinase [Rhizobiaceae bacterium]
MTPCFAAIDWGTSNFRLWLVDDEGNVIARKTSAQGMATLSADRYADVMEEHLAGLGVPPDLPAVVCGMAGSRSGWAEAPYLDTPVSIDRISGSAVQPCSQARPVWIMSGVCQHDPESPDVMRGEETQIVGAWAIAAREGLFCLPGTHSKWVEIDNGKIVRFHTFMTGELFALISQRSVLAPTLEDPENGLEEAAYSNAVAEMLDQPGQLTQKLFGIRASRLLSAGKQLGSLSRLSGLLIGAELAAARRTFPSTGAVTLISDGEVGRNYNIALRQAGFDVINLDAESATLRGLVEAATKLLNNGSALEKPDLNLKVGS